LNVGEASTRDRIAALKSRQKKTIGSPNNKEAGPLELDVLNHLPDLKIVGGQYWL